MKEGIVLRNIKFKNKGLLAALGILEYVDMFVEISESLESGKYIVTINELDWSFKVKVYYDFQNSNSSINTSNDYHTIGDLQIPITELKQHEYSLKLLFSYLISLLIKTKKQKNESELSLKINEIHLDQTLSKLKELKIIGDDFLKVEVS